ncbi:unnamed protein product [Orchesella dallaii]|uniref:Uncharacterized protein n=1 Tax=Orchesella dallaii TaxID=48710 RepID=A0ABP1PMP6_9HEXA
MMLWYESESCEYCVHVDEYLKTLDPTTLFEVFLIAMSLGVIVAAVYELIYGKPGESNQKSADKPADKIVDA